MIRLLTIFILIFSNIFATVSFAKMAELTSVSNTSLEWQINKLQDSVEQKIQKALAPVIAEKDFIIDVKVDLDFDKAEEPSPKKITKNLQKKKVKFTTEELPKEGDDFVVFNKLGLEAPIIGDEGTEIENSEAEQSQKAIIELNDRYNIYKFIKSIDVKLVFDQAINAKSKESIKKILDSLTYNFRDIVPQYNIQYIDFQNAKVFSKDFKDAKQAGGAGGAGNTNGELINAFKSKFNNLDIMLGLIISSIVIALVLFIIAKKYLDHKGKEETEKEKESEDKKDDEHDDEHGDDMAIDLTKTDALTLKINEGLERFRKVMANNFSNTILMLKSWVKNKNAEETQGLKALVQLLTNAELQDIFKSMNPEERTAWKMILDVELTKDELAKAFSFVGNSVIKMMMEPSLIEDFEICDLILDLQSDDIVEMWSNNPKLAALLMNILNPTMISSIIAKLPIEKSEMVIEESSNFKKESITAVLPELKKELARIKESKTRSPFIGRIFEIVPKAKAEIETGLYKALLKNVKRSEVVDLAVRYFPNILADKIPHDAFKYALTNMELSDQIKYLVCQENNRDSLLEDFAPKGSKNRDMLDLELQDILKDESKVKKIITESKESISEKYITNVRDFIVSDYSTQLQVKEVIEQWVNILQGKAPLELVQDNTGTNSKTPGTEGGEEDSGSQAA